MVRPAASASLGKARETFAGVQRLKRRRGAAPATANFGDELEESAHPGATSAFRRSQKILTGLQDRRQARVAGRPPIKPSRVSKDVENFLTLPESGSELVRSPSIVLVVGVNGSGKTTTIGKLATALKEIAAKYTGRGDTFRAAAAEQLAIWAERAGVEHGPRQRRCRSVVGGVRRNRGGEVARCRRRHRRYGGTVAEPRRI